MSFLAVLAAGPTTTTAAMAATPVPSCSTVLPASGMLLFAGPEGMGAPNLTLTLTAAATLLIDCPPPPSLSPSASPSPSSSSSPSIAIDISLINVNLDDDAAPDFSDFRDPFLASTFPVCYALAATTVTAWLLLAVLFMTPRIFLDGGVVYLGRWGFTNGSGGVRIGGRPWLQKVAAFLVAVSLTIASVDTFRVAQNQYLWGIQSAAELQKEVMGGTELKVIGLISDTFLWLAQAQTLIRLFPRQRDQMVIKWAAFALITLDSLFGGLNSFIDMENGSQGSSRPKSFTEPVSTLSYLLHLGLGLIYAGWVVYYSITKRRYAYYHPLMPNMCLIAAISLTAVLAPVAFFILDVCKPDVTGWSEYVRWVGAAAASVVVWEWVERIEEVEREEKKDGILGRELVDGDDGGLEVGAPEVPRGRRRLGRKEGSRPDSDEDEDDEDHSQQRPPRRHSLGHGGGGGGGGGDVDGGRTGSRLWPGVSSATFSAHPGGDNDDRDRRGTRLMMHTDMPARPQPVARLGTDDDSPSSGPGTEYTVRYPDAANPAGTRQSNDRAPAGSRHPAAALGSTDPAAEPSTSTGRPWWRDSLFRRPEGPPAEVLPHRAAAANNGEEDEAPRAVPHQRPGRWDLRARLEEFAANQVERIRERMRPAVETASLPVTVIPAPPRRGEVLARVLGRDEQLRSESGSRYGSRSSSEDGRARPRGGGGGDGVSALPPLWPGVQRVYEDDDLSESEPDFGGSDMDSFAVSSGRTA